MTLSRIASPKRTEPPIRDPALEHEGNSLHAPAIKISPIGKRQAVTSPDTLAAKMDALRERFEEEASRTRTNFSEIKAKQDKTNGRVGRGELKLARLGGAMAAVVFFTPFLIFAADQFTK